MLTPLTYDDIIISEREINKFRKERQKNMRTNEKWADGTEILRITSVRNFTYHGRKFMVGNLCKADIKDGKKYCLYEVEKDDSLELMHNSIGWDLLKFKTIKDARRWVRDWDWCTVAWD